SSVQLLPSGNVPSEWGSPVVRLAPIAVGAWAAAAVGTTLPASYSVVAAIAGSISAGLLRRRTGAIAVAGGLALGVAIAGISAAWHVHRLDSGEVPRLAQRHATAEVAVTLVRDPVPARSPGATGLFVVNGTALHVPVLLLA